MITDILKNSALYYSLHPRLKRAFGYLASSDLRGMEPGRYEFEGDDIFMNVMDVDLKRPEDAKLEAHNTYIDIQVVIRGVENFGWSPRSDLKLAQGSFDEQKDVIFYDDPPQMYYSIKEEQFTILMPHDGHAPLVGEGHVKKLIMKVRI